MSGPFPFFVSVWMKFFFLFTPFFALSMFLSRTGVLGFIAAKG